MKDSIKRILIIVTAALFFPLVSAGKQTAEVFKGKVSFEYQYLLYTPDSYKEDKSKEYPLILFLHGGGERGDDLNKVRKHGPPKILESRKDFPAIVVSPQCPDYEGWIAFKLNTLLEALVEKYRVDRSRIYLTGLSMGGYGSWDLGTKYPNWFAAIAPVCGGGDTRRAARALKDTPIWTFHGMKDPVIPFERTLEMVRALENVDGNVKLTVYPEAKHDSWTETYDNPEFWKWMFEQKREKDQSVDRNPNPSTHFEFDGITVDDAVATEMERHNIIGLSLAIIENGEIVKAKGYGFTDRSQKNPVTPNTLFQAGSISKPVAALGALRLVEEGMFSLDENINDRLEQWQVPENKFTKEEKVTLRRILNHSAGLTVHGFPVYTRKARIP